MKLRRTTYLLLFLLSAFFIMMSCEKVLMEKNPPNDPMGNFESLWKTVDERYAYFDYKQIDWEGIYLEYSLMINDGMTDTELFDVLGAMLNELRDGHVNLFAPFDISRFTFNYMAPENFNWRLIKDHYIGWDYRVTGSIAHAIIERQGMRFAYLRYSSFSNSISRADLEYILESVEDTEGLILDIRSNGGGSVSNIYMLGEVFADIERHVYTTRIKTGPEHNDFGNIREVNMYPDSNLYYDKPVAVLINRGCYSATSIFSLAMKAFPHLTLVGDTTGGGFGAPAGYELPNGWAYRFSVSQTLSPEGENFENGVPPDVAVWMDPEDELNGTDNILETAIEILSR